MAKLGRSFAIQPKLTSDFAPTSFTGNGPSFHARKCKLDGNACRSRTASIVQAVAAPWDKPRPEWATAPSLVNFAPLSLAAPGRKLIISGSRHLRVGCIEHFGNESLRKQGVDTAGNLDLSDNRGSCRH